ncbi:MAG: hypothetical protein IPP90_10220 [Gemmatimonadaceae bacterium]|nr:hypothetical protein [Gemmatimonadaceae bacterium]
MSIRTVCAAIAAIIVASPVALRAQDAGADFAKARQQFVAGQPRPAAQTLLVASLHVRQEVGRSKDEVVGMRLLDAEGQLEKMAAGIRTGAVSSVKTLDQSLSRIDRLLAQHHLQLASAVIAKPHDNELPMVARDVDRAAFHFERSITLDGHALAADQTAAVTDARALAKEIEGSKSLPKTAATVVAALERLVVGTTVVAVK